MDSAQRLLFGKFPRAVGVTTPDAPDMELRQYLIHSDHEFDGVITKVRAERNLYSSISMYQPVRVDGDYEGNAVVTDKVSFDFDSPAKADPDNYPDMDPDEKPRWSHTRIPSHMDDSKVIEKMRGDASIRDAVLGDICDDVQRLARASIEEGIPVFGVFSGFGIHVHQLYEPTASRPGDKMGSNANKWISELTLSTVDDAATGKPYRIMRVPNVPRIDHEGGGNTRLYTVPLRADELAEITPGRLMDLSTNPRPRIGSEPPSRPAMKVREDYFGEEYEDGLGQEKMRPVPEESFANELAEKIVKDTVKMPCVYERAFGRNPPNPVRVKLGIMFLNAGYSPEEATRIFEQLNWVDFDREVTKYQLEKLYENGKGDWSCRTMQGKGLCVRADNKKECPAYGYRGGNDPRMG